MNDIEVLDYLKYGYSEEAFDRAIECVKYQIPQKPGRTEAYPHRLYCPRCYWTFFFNEADWLRDMFKYCPECGQKIDWSGWKEHKSE